MGTAVLAGVAGAGLEGLILTSAHEPLGAHRRRVLAAGLPCSYDPAPPTEDLTATFNSSLPSPLGMLPGDSPHPTHFPPLP